MQQSKYSWGECYAIMVYKLIMEYHRKNMINPSNTQISQPSQANLKAAIADQN